MRINLMKVLFATAILCLSVMSAFAQSKSPGLPAGQGEILDLLQTWNQAEVKGDEAAVAKALSSRIFFSWGQQQERISCVDEAKSVVNN